MHRKGPARDITHQICQPSDVLIGGATLNSEFGLQNGPLPLVCSCRETKLINLRKVHHIKSLILTTIPEKYLRLLFLHHSQNTQNSKYEIHMKWTQKTSLEKPNGSSVDALAHCLANQSSGLNFWLSARASKSATFQPKGSRTRPRPPMESGLQHLIIYCLGYDLS